MIKFLSIINSLLAIIHQLGSFMSDNIPHRNKKVEEASVILNNSIDAIGKADESVKKRNMSKRSANHCSNLIAKFANGVQKEIDKSFTTPRTK